MARRCKISRRKGEIMELGKHGKSQAGTRSSKVLAIVSRVTRNRKRHSGQDDGDPNEKKERKPEAYPTAQRNHKRIHFKRISERKKRGP